MLKIRITNLEGDRKEVVHEVAGHEATIGRAPDSDVVVPDGHVSARHAKIFTGLIVVDLGSTNGTFVDGSRVHPAALVRDGQFMLGTEIAVEVMPEEPVDEDFGFEQTLINPSAQEPLRSSAFQRQQQVSAGGSDETALGQQPAASPPPAASGDLAEVVARQQSENEDLRRRLDSLKKDIQGRESADSGSPQARLAHDAMLRVREQNEALQGRILELEKQKGRADVEAAKKVLENRIAELESNRADLSAETARLRGELEAAQKEQEESAARPASDIFFKLQQEIQRLKKELEAVGTPGASTDGASGELFFELREDNARLQRELERARSAGSPPNDGASPAEIDERVAKLESELHTERMSKADMLDELGRLRSKAEVKAAVPTPAVRPGEVNQVLALLHRAADEDVHQLPTDMGLPIAEFLTLEMFRFVRHGEKIITRLAGAFIQLYNPQTVLPDAEKTLRELTMELLDAGEDPGLRAEYTDYLDKLKKWLAVAVQAYPRAAESYAIKLRDDLSEESLTKDDPIPRFKRLSGHAEGELWTRAAKVLDGMSDETVRDGVERLARIFASEMFDTLDDNALA